MTVSPERIAEMLPCPFCGKAAYVSDPETPSQGYEIGCPDNWDFKRGNRGHCNAAPAVTGMNYAEAVAAWNRRSQLSGITEETSSGLEPLTAEAVNHVLSLLEVYAPDEFSQEMAANVVSRALEAVKRFPAPK